jgi:5-methylcytosine-specific restriction endonuclease McrA
MKPSIQEVITAAKKTKTYQKIGYFTFPAYLLLFYFLAFFPSFIILPLLCIIAFQLLINKLGKPHKEILNEFAKVNNWYYPVDTELHSISGQRRRARFYSSMQYLLSDDDIIERVLSNDFAVRDPQPSGAVPRKQSAPLSYNTFTVNSNSDKTTSGKSNDDEANLTLVGSMPDLPILPDIRSTPTKPVQDFLDVEIMATHPKIEVNENKIQSTSNKTTIDLLGNIMPTEEGARKLKTRYARVRSAKLREAAIKIHGRDCCVCGTNFDKKYGIELSQGYIEVHHLKRIAGGVRKTDPKTDLVTLCSNCHKMADRLAQKLEVPPSTIEDLRQLLFPRSAE